MKVIHLPYGAGISTLSRALRNQGIEATSCSLNAMNIYHYLADIRLNLFKYNNQQRDALRKELFKESLKKYDIFHFHFGETFFPDKSDLKILKQRGKKMIVEHRGSDVRMLSVAKKFNNPYVRVIDKWPEKKFALI